MLRIFFFFRLEPEGAFKNKRKGCNEKQEKRGGSTGKIQAANVVASQPSELRLQRRRSCQKMRVDY